MNARRKRGKRRVWIQRSLSRELAAEQVMNEHVEKVAHNKEVRRNARAK